MPDPLLCVLVKTLGGTPQGNAQVDLIKGGNTIGTLISGTNGWVCFDAVNLQSGTYLIEARYPIPPNDSRSGQKVHSYTSGTEYSDVKLDVFY